MVTFFLTGRFKTVFHLDISGNWSFRILIVFWVAVAVRRTSFPSRLASSPVESSIAGRNAALQFLSRPQFTTIKVKL